MEFSQLTLRLLLLFFPGFICVLVLDTLTVSRRKTAGFFLIYAFVLGVASYLVLGLLAQVVQVGASVLDGWDFSGLVFFKALTDPQPKLPWTEIVLASLVAVGLAVGLTAAHTHKLIHRLARSAGVSRKSGEEDTWNYFLNDPGRDWVVVRDFSHGLAYEGYAEAWTPTIASPAEILLSDVTVYRNSSGEKLYHVDGVYLARDTEAVTIEVPEYQDVGEDGTGQGENVE